MEILTRAEAKAQNRTQYFTGQPCKNGHTAYRYTQSGTCSQCIRAAASPIVDAAYDARKAAKAQMVQAKFRLFDSDRELFAAAAYGFAAMRFPELQPGDVDPQLLPTDVINHTGMVKINCHLADVEPLRELAVQMFNQKTAANLDIPAARRKAFGPAADMPVAPVPDAARIPRPGDFDYK